MYIGDKLRNDPDNATSIMADNIDGINDLYINAIAMSLDEEEVGEDSLAIICTIIAICLINDIHEVKFPLQYEKGDEDLIAKIASQLSVLLLLEDMTERKQIIKTRIDGEDVYSLPEENKNDKKS